MLLKIQFLQSHFCKFSELCMCTEETGRPLFLLYCCTLLLLYVV